MHLVRHPLVLRPLFSTLSVARRPTLFLPVHGRCLTFLPCPHRFVGRSFSAEAKLVEDAKSDRVGFFAEEGVSWQSLGISDHISRALAGVSLQTPSAVQAASIPHILSGSDVVVAAETGSGKTHSYLVPLIQNLCGNFDLEINGTKGIAGPDKMSLVLCPNVMLCEQIVQMANCIVNDMGKPLMKVASVCGQRGWPVAQPQLIVSTPAALLNHLLAFEPEERRRGSFVRNVKVVVFDEADLLLCGSFQNKVIQIINMFRFDEKVLSKMQSSENSIKDSSQNSSEHFESEYEEELHLVGEQDDTSEDDSADHKNCEPCTDKDEPAVKDWRRVRKSYIRSKQYIFVAATLPGNGKKTAGGLLRRMFPEAIWLSGNYLHRHNPSLELRWIQVNTDTQIDALLDAVRSCCNKKLGSFNDDVYRTMVFTNTVASAESVAKILHMSEIECTSYHSESSLEERTRNLIDFRDKGGILVCTDAAARGLDIPNVSHVIQAEFASSAVDFLHRIGRTARAGRSGIVTSLYTDSNRDLVAAVRQAMKTDQPVESAFSRKRSFRNKIKKLGRSRAEVAPKCNSMT
ncbi:hypothetical protein HPP92_016382 [Vanilla planifolia]|uniref:RNA helicase n=1 Tax=Vanilla planifolia TaxID=51239 RepID=A0A835UU56_VANPL|nr:hypothetical protein HPP92_016382 [Vanilla planifolia]